MASFSKAFAAARRRLGPGKTFTWNGRSYSTNYAEEEKGSATRPRQRPATLTSPRPRERPSRMGVMVETNAEAPSSDIDIPTGRAAAASYANPDIALAASRAAEDVAPTDDAPKASRRPRRRARAAADTSPESALAARDRAGDALLDEYKRKNRFRQRYDEAVEYVSEGMRRRGR